MDKKLPENVHAKALEWLGLRHELLHFWRDGAVMATRTDKQALNIALNLFTRLAKDYNMEFSDTDAANIVSDIAMAIDDERERCARAAESAKLPRRYQWGHDAMEQFNFGKDRAAATIRRLK